ncbi:MAG: DNA repair protein RadA [Deltaproteobacteria bacterium]|jgi:DNA repair protein RadA/Sms|nr:DNA repair protein RadA [Deltaproteobacteria bacterium]
MAKVKSKFVCRECGYVSSAYMGRCPVCQAWDSFAEVRAVPAAPGSGRPSARGGPAASGPGRGAVALSEIPAGSTVRLKTGLAELDRVLGGGLTPGAVVLLAGEPGVGKSTLLLQAAAGTASQGGRLLYVTGEESAAQVKTRAERLGLDPGQLWVLAETSLPEIEAVAGGGGWDVLAVDSIQTVTIPELGGQAGSPGQLRECAARLTALAKAAGTPLWLVGHITKEGHIAGPKLLEHLVDTVLYFEGERDRPLRILRSFKNRFGSVNETGVFEMTGRGLGQVRNPSELFLAERPRGASGSVVAPVLEGNRPLLMEVQALVSPSPLAMPRRQTVGVDNTRMSLLSAVLEKKAGLRLYDRDVFVNVAGGARIGEPAADLAVAAAVASSWLDRAVPPDTVVVGEVGLAGEVRRVGRLKERLAEAARMGFTRAVVPGDEAGLTGSPGRMRLAGVASVQQFLSEQFDFRPGRRRGSPWGGRGGEQGPPPGGAPGRTGAGRALPPRPDPDEGGAFDLEGYPGCEDE